MANIIDPNGIYTLDEVVKILDVSEKTLSKAIKSGELVAKKIGYGFKITGDNLLRFAGGSPAHPFFQEPEIPVVNEAGPEAFK